MRFPKNRAALITLSLLLLCMGAWVIFNKSDSAESTASSTSENQNSAVRRVLDAVDYAKDEIQARTNQGTVEKAIQKEILSLNQAMDFYGKVVDHLGRGIGGATIVYTWDVQQAAQWVPTKTSSGRTQSEADGTFEIHLEAVRWITIEKITRDGYVRQGGGGHVRRSYTKQENINYYNSDSRNPELFYLTPIAEIVPLFRSSDGSGIDSIKNIRLPKDGKPVKIDIRTGEPSTEGELEIILNLGPRVDGPYPYTPWTAKIRMPGGGLFETTPDQQKRYPERAPVAPLEGYVEEVDYSDPMSGRSYSRTFYFRTREGLYCALGCEVRANHLGGGVDLGVRLNPNPGNRLLHFDPHKRIK